MSADQIFDYIGIICLVIVAIATGIDAALSFYIKRAAELKKPVPQQVMTIDEIAKFVVSEAATLDASGAEKKVQAVKALIDQANAEGKKVTVALFNTLTIKDRPMLQSNPPILNNLLKLVSWIAEMILMDPHKPKTFNELIFNSFEKDKQKGGKVNVKLERAKKKLWSGRIKLPVRKH